MGMRKAYINLPKGHYEVADFSISDFVHGAKGFNSAMISKAETISARNKSLLRLHLHSNGGSYIVDLEADGNDLTAHLYFPDADNYLSPELA